LSDTFLLSKHIRTDKFWTGGVTVLDKRLWCPSDEWVKTLVVPEVKYLDKLYDLRMYQRERNDCDDRALKSWWAARALNAELLHIAGIAYGVVIVRQPKKGKHMLNFYYNEREDIVFYDNNKRVEWVKGTRRYQAWM